MTTSIIQNEIKYINMTSKTLIINNKEYEASNIVPTVTEAENTYYEDENVSLVHSIFGEIVGLPYDNNFSNIYIVDNTVAYRAKKQNVCYVFESSDIGGKTNVLKLKSY